MLPSNLNFGPVYEPLNNGVLSGVRPSPAKDINTFHESEFVMGRKEFVQRFSPSTMNQTKQKWLNGVAVPFVTDPQNPTDIGKRWVPNANRDASSIAAKERVKSLGQASLNASGGALSYGTHNRQTIQQDVARQRSRLRGSGKSAPAKCRSASATICSVPPIFLAKPTEDKDKSVSYTCGPAAVEKLRGNKSVLCQTEASKTASASLSAKMNQKGNWRVYSTRFYPLGRFQTWAVKPNPTGLFSIPVFVPLPSH